MFPQQAQAGIEVTVCTHVCGMFWVRAGTCVSQNRVTGTRPRDEKPSTASLAPPVPTECAVVQPGGGFRPGLPALLVFHHPGVPLHPRRLGLSDFFSVVLVIIFSADKALNSRKIWV